MNYSEPYTKNQTFAFVVEPSFQYLGTWQTLPMSSEILAVHAALLSFGKVLYFSGSQHDPRLSERDSQFYNIDATRVFDSENMQVQNIPSPPGHDLFCCGHAFLQNGELLVAGGTGRYSAVRLPNDPHGGHYQGISGTTIFGHNSPNPWITCREMTRVMRTGHDNNGMQGEQSVSGRWYPTLLTLSDGKVLAMGGHSSGDSSIHQNNTLELFNPDNRTWESRPSSEDIPDESESDNGYVRLHLLPNGQVFSVMLGWDKSSRTWSPGTGWSNPIAYLGAPYNMFGALYEMSSVLLPLRPPYRDVRVMVVGASNPKIINLSQHLDPTLPWKDSVPSWNDTEPRNLNWHDDRDPCHVVRLHQDTTNPERYHCNVTLLPDGTVLVTGGLRNKVDDTTGVREAELYDPRPTNLRPLNADGRPMPVWSTLAKAHRPRGYHHVALLLPSGLVWITGSNKNGDYSWDNRGAVNNPNDFGPQGPDQEQRTNDYPNGFRQVLDPTHDMRELSMELFYPPYLFRGRRPVIQASPDIIVPQTDFSVHLLK